ncbi:MAG: DUF3604 domain-containing protein [Candidatus Sulfotelmatobacter sp.]
MKGKSEVMKYFSLLLWLVLAAAFTAWAGDGSQPHKQEASRPAPNPLRNAYFGDLHVHTSYSLDAYSMGNRNDPRMAYRFGRGEAVVLPGGQPSQLKEPLDFMAVTDHDIWLGELSLCEDPSDPAYKTGACQALRNSTQDPVAGSKAMWGFAAAAMKGIGVTAERNPVVCGSAVADENNKCFQRAQTIWQQIQKNADEFYQPGKFTTFAGYEWTAGFKRVGMLHRNVIFRGGQVPQSVYSAVDLNNSPERLWQWLEKACTGECQVISIPHNTNFGWGVALASNNSDGTPFTTEGLTRRAKTEPIIEIFQSKGNSECTPGLGTNDEQCNFEQLFKPCPPGETAFCAVASNYVRNALKTGLLLEDQYGVNPFKYGFIGSTDTHSSAPGATEEGAWPGTGSLGDAQPATRLRGIMAPQFPVKAVLNNPGGLAGVWAEENTREAIFDALKRRETFATSGTRIRVRFFGGWSYSSDLHRRRDLVEAAYKGGVPMGGDLPQKPSRAKAPRFVAWATKDANSANLEKIQIVKGWAEGGETFEKVYDIVCSDGLKPDSKTHLCADNGATVNLSDCSYASDKGTAELSANWTDPDFKPDDRAFYYVRVLENPTCRWSTYDAHRANVPLPTDAPPTIQERAWSSPIWFTPASSGYRSAAK